MMNAEENLILMNEQTQVSSIGMAQYDIKNMIYLVRNQQVMVDSELAMLYQVETRVLNQAVKRNIERFPERFRFQLTKDEYENLISQFVISSLDEEKSGYGGRRKLPYVFTEQGIAMLSSVLRSETAIRTSIHIMDSFVEMRRFLANNALLFERISNVELKQLEYQKKTDAENFNAQYPTLEVKYTKAFHDRFLILDGETAYHVGASLKDAGKKCFGINLIQDAKMIKDILQRLELETEDLDEAI